MMYDREYRKSHPACDDRDLHDRLASKRNPFEKPGLDHVGIGLRRLFPRGFVLGIVSGALRKNTRIFLHSVPQLVCFLPLFSAASLFPSPKSPATKLITSPSAWHPKQ